MKLSFLETKASQVGKPQGVMPSAALSKNKAATQSARLVAIILHLLSGGPFHVDPQLLPVPTVPAKLDKAEMAKRSLKGVFTGEERSEKSDDAQKLRKQAQAQTPGQDFSTT